MITKEHEFFEEGWMGCLEVIEASSEVMGNPVCGDSEWCDEMKAKWVVKTSDECLMGKYLTWSEIRKVLWEHYVSEEQREKWVEVFGSQGWESDEECE